MTESARRTGARTLLCVVALACLENQEVGLVPNCLDVHLFGGEIRSSVTTPTYRPKHGFL